MVLNKIPSFSEVKAWVNANTATSVNGETGDITVSEIPSGLISMWSGSTTNVPTGWALCDGSNGTPNLMDKFVVGAGSGYGVGATGGAESVTLTEAQMPSHAHDQSRGNDSRTSGSNVIDNGGYDYSYSTVSTGSAGGDAAHENRPPYYAVAYVMKL